VKSVLFALFIGIPAAAGALVGGSVFGTWSLLAMCFLLVVSLAMAFWVGRSWSLTAAASLTWAICVLEIFSGAMYWLT
jgi:hypothetical protein